MDRVVNRISTVGMDRLLSVIDTNVLNASGDNSATPAGLRTSGYFTAYSTSLRANTVIQANIVDVIKNMVLQANNADQDVNVVIVHPSRLNEIRQEKDEIGNSVTDRNVVFDTFGNVVSIWGLTVIQNKNQTVDRVTVMWNEAAEIGMLEDITFEIGTNGNDLTEGMRTIVFWMRAAFGVGKPGAIFLSSNPDSDIALINAI